MEPPVVSGERGMITLMASVHGNVTAITFVVMWQVLLAQQSGQFVTQSTQFVVEMVRTFE